MKIYLIDFENTQSAGLIGLNKAKLEDSRILLFYTKNAPTIQLDVFAELGTIKLECIRVKSGKQSLDRHLISYLGYLIGKEAEKKNEYIIVSRDNGYQEVA